MTVKSEVRSAPTGTPITSAVAWRRVTKAVIKGLLLVLMISVTMQCISWRNCPFGVIAPWRNCPLGVIALWRNCPLGVTALWRNCPLGIESPWHSKPVSPSALWRDRRLRNCPYHPISQPLYLKLCSSVALTVSNERCKSTPGQPPPTISILHSFKYPFKTICKKAGLNEQITYAGEQGTNFIATKKIVPSGRSDFITNWLSKTTMMLSKFNKGKGNGRGYGGPRRDNVEHLYPNYKVKMALQHPTHPIKTKDTGDVITRTMTVAVFLTPFSGRIYQNIAVGTLKEGIIDILLCPGTGVVVARNVPYKVLSYGLPVTSVRTADSRNNTVVGEAAKSLLRSVTALLALSSNLIYDIEPHELLYIMDAEASHQTVIIATPKEFNHNSGIMGQDKLLGGIISHTINDNVPLPLALITSVIKYTISYETSNLPTQVVQPTS